MTEKPDVRPGQVWADCDWRSSGRTLRVLGVEGGIARCVVLTLGHNTFTGVGRVKKIKVARFRPTSTGYRLVTDAPSEESR